MRDAGGTGGGRTRESRDGRRGTRGGRRAPRTPSADHAGRARRRRPIAHAPSGAERRRAAPRRAARGPRTAPAAASARPAPKGRSPRGSWSPSATDAYVRHRTRTRYTPMSTPFFGLRHIPDARYKNVLRPSAPLGQNREREESPYIY